MLTRLATLPLIVVMIGAEVFTKFPLAAREGFWTYAHEACTELGQLFGLVFLLVVGAGVWSLEHRLHPPTATGDQPASPPNRDFTHRRNPTMNTTSPWLPHLSSSAMLLRLKRTDDGREQALADYVISHAPRGDLDAAIAASTASSTRAPS